MYFMTIHCKRMAWLPVDGLEKGDEVVAAGELLDVVRILMGHMFL